MSNSFRLNSLHLALVAVAVFLSAGPATAQGLISALPTETGQWVRYEGTYTQVIERDDIEDLKLSWTRHVEVKDLATEEAEFRGEQVPCHWIEIKVSTGPAEEGVIDAGPGGIRYYKILIPESAIRGVKLADDGTVLDEKDILASHVPIVKGWRKIGNEEPQPITSQVFQMYPAISLLQHYRTVENLGSENVDVAQQAVAATHLKGELTQEDAFTRSKSTGEIWTATGESAPFGTVKWRVTTIVEGKSSTDSRDKFKQISQITEELTAVEVRDGAETELDTANLPAP